MNEARTDGQTEPVVRICFHCKHVQPIRDWQNFDELKPPHGYYCPKINNYVDPEFTCDEWKSKF
jgi:hypothetical protein